MTRESHSGHISVHAGRGLWMKVNLPVFKDGKSRYAVTFPSWHWDVAIFLQSGWDDQHFYLTSSAHCKGCLGNLARNLGKDATLSDILQMLDKHCVVVMMLNVLSKELYSLKQGLSENVAEFGVCLSQQVQILQSEYPGRIASQNTWKR